MTKGSQGTYRPSLLKSFSSKFGSMFCNCGLQNKYKRLDIKLEKKIVEFKRTSSRNANFKSFDSIVLRFPRFREALKNIRGVFEQFDEDSNGSIDRDELKRCLQKMEINLKEQEVEDLFRSCDIDGSQGIQFNEFIVLLCLIYLLEKSPSSVSKTSRTCSAELEATFDTIVDAFLFLDKSGDGKLRKEDVLKALNETSPWEKSPARITKTRFQEMDWDHNGEVSFRKFLFALINWVGIDSDEETHMVDEPNAKE